MFFFSRCIKYIVLIQGEIICEDILNLSKVPLVIFAFLFLLAFRHSIFQQDISKIIQVVASLERIFATFFRLLNRKLINAFV